MAVKLTIEDMHQIANAKEGKCLSTVYVDANTKLKWMCKEGHTWDAIPGSIKKGTWCPICAREIRRISRIGRHPSEETRKKQSDSHKGNHLSEEQKRKISEALKGKNVSEETRKKLSEANKGKSNSSAKNLPQAFKKGQVGWNKGKKGLQVPWNKNIKTGKVLICSICNKEFYASPSKIKRGAKYCSHSCMFKDSELIKKLSESHKGQILSPTNIEKLRRINTEREYKKASEETRRKLSTALKGKISWNKGKRTGLTPWNKGKKMPEMSGANHPRFGRPYSEESLRKMSESHKKQMANPEFRKKLSEIHNQRLSNPEEMKRQVEVSRRTLLKLYESGAFPKQTDTKPEREIKAELIKRGYKEGIDFIHQYKFMNKFMCDFCFPQKKVVIEVDGDFWHANPEKYPAGSILHKHQIKDVNKDKAKTAYIRTVDNHSWTLIRLWESDIKKDVKSCVDKIEEILNNPQ